jgi:hypothetical protein
MKTCGYPFAYRGLIVSLLYLGCNCLTAAQVQWKLFGDNGKAEFYYDPSSITVQGETVSVWEMLNYSFPLNQVLSSRSHKEFDCTTGKFRNLGGEFFSGPMLSGDILSKSNEAENTWRVPVEGTKNLELMRLVCPTQS